MAEVEQRMAAPGFWDDAEAAKRTLSQSKRLKKWIDPLAELTQALQDLRVLEELATRESDAEAAGEAAGEAALLQERLERFEFLLMFKDEDDTRNAILTIHPGAGGTESADWAEMLWRMYQRYIERQGWESRLLDMQKNEEAGIKSVTVEVLGELAYGKLKAERGVHRLVRISPFDAAKRRHTSFASVFVYPEVEEAAEIAIDEGDLRIDTFRASSAGGQHVNKTSSAVRITHLPSGIVVSCQDERSQHRNRENAMKILMARLYQQRREAEQAQRQKLEDKKLEIGWGSQIRSYVFHPYTMVKDHRTDVETGSVQAVMDGDLDRFVEAWLKRSAGMAVGGEGGAQ
jgi:peptide chain release factor 2